MLAVVFFVAVLFLFFTQGCVVDFGVGAMEVVVLKVACVCVYVCVCARARACVRVCVRACVRVRVCVYV